ncbi:MAG: phytanoyl-CoA dioxygenase family protein [Gemmatimonadetes bacterium]|nr:phytanoyl-CoA dioxygenase family protein [Gemmatimonadota bacterium]
MDVYEKYFFDVNGYLVVEDILSAEQVAALNEAIDHNRDNIRIRKGENRLSGGVGRHGGEVSIALEGSHGRGDIGSILRWPKPWCQPFRDLLSHLPTMHYMLDMIGNGFRYGNANGISMTRGAEGHLLHGGGGFLGGHMYFCKDGKMWNNLIAVCYQLADVNPGDGGFVCISGSHKANFECPTDVRRMERDLGCFKHIPMKAGSAVIFTEALTHGAMPWTADHERRTLLYRYAAGGYVNPPSGNDPAKYAPFMDELTPLQQAIMQPPHNAGRIDVAALIEAEEKASAKN